MKPLPPWALQFLYGALIRGISRAGILSGRMRRLVVLAALVLLALPAGLSARSAANTPGSLSIRKGRGEVVLQVKGAVIGRVASGKVTLTDGDPYDEEEPDVKGRIKPPKPLNDATTVYRGHQIRFRVMEGSYRLKIEGRGINLSGVGRGWVILDGDERFADVGVFSLNGEPYEPIPYERTERLKLVVAADPGEGHRGQGP